MEPWLQKPLAAPVFNFYFNGNNGLANAKLTLDVSQASASAVTANLTIGSNAAAWKFVAITISGGQAAGGTATVYDISDASISASVAMPAAMVLTTATNIEFETAPYSNTIGVAAGSIDMAFEAIIPATALTLTQLQTLYAQVKVRMAALGISI